MSFNHYYQSELSALREQGRHFAQRNPALAPYLASSSSDPDIERLLEGVAFLTGRLRQKLDDELPELTHSLMHLLWPNCMRPLPSFAMLQFDPLKRPQSELLVPAGTPVESRPIDGVRCRFRTAGQTRLLPLDIQQVSFHSHSLGARLELRLGMTAEGSLQDLQLERLRLHLSGDEHVSRSLYLLLTQHLQDIKAQPLDNDGQPLSTERSSLHLPGSQLQAAGFDAGQALLPYPDNTFAGYRHLQEYFAFAEKFLFVELNGLSQLQAQAGDGLKAARGLSLQFELRHPSCRQISPGREHLRLHCAPVVNLFAHDATPIRLDGRQDQYLLRPAELSGEHCGIFSVDNVTGWKPGGMGYRRYAPFESFEHDRRLGNGEPAPCYSLRQYPSLLGDNPDSYLCFAQHSQDQQETLSVELTCTNHHLPTRLAQGDICMPCDGTPEFVQFRNIGRVTPSYAPPLHEDGMWRLISNMALNYQSLEDIGALRRVLGSYDLPRHHDQQAARISQQRLDGLLQVAHRQVARLQQGLPLRGIRTELQLDAERYNGAGDLYLFCSVLNEFLAHHACLNTYHELSVTTLQGDAYQWAPRMGLQPLF
tara:strand:+ start:914 stop:2692 length:1779 start_codon:yes stop_codon:yes gene_type:complete